MSSSSPVPYLKQANHSGSPDGIKSLSDKNASFSSIKKMLLQQMVRDDPEHRLVAAILTSAIVEQHRRYIGAQAQKFIHSKDGKMWCDLTGLEHDSVKTIAKQWLLISGNKYQKSTSEHTCNFRNLIHCSKSSSEKSVHSISERLKIYRYRTVIQ